MASMSESDISPTSRVARQMAEEHPEEVMLVTPTSRLSYRELNERTDRLAHRILDTVGATGRQVGMQITGSEALLVSALALVRAGMVTVTIDPKAPFEWRNQIVDDCEAALLLTDAATDDRDWAPPGCPTIDPRIDPPGIVEPVDRHRGDVSAITYTSGSTGVPKGVIRAANVDMTTGLDSRIKEVAYGSRLGFLGQGSVGWSHRLLLMAVECRCPIVAYELRGAADETVGHWLARTRIEWIATVPTVLRHVLKTMPPGATLPDMRLLALGGEATTGEDVAGALGLAPRVLVVVAFGSTEAGAYGSSAFSAEARPEPGPIPIHGTTDEFELAIEDELGQPVPDGEIGELVVTPNHPNHGYWRRPELNAVFERRSDERLHIRTGDRARRRADGAIDHLGRIDHVIKVAGNRVELGAVEAALLDQEGVVDAVAAPYADQTGAVRLTAAVVAAAHAHLSRRVLRAEMGRRVPAYMVPDEVMILAELPRLTNGKVDRLTLAAMQERRLTETGRFGGADEEVAEDGNPAAVLTDALLSIFCDVLQRRDVGWHDDFFDIGGDSLRAVELFFEIEQQLGFRCPPTVLLQAPTAFDLAHALRIRSLDATAIIPIQLGDSHRAPLFVVDAGTNGLSASRLAGGLGADQPVYELWVSADEPTFQDVAARCVAAVSAVAPTGPYVLYGFSLSGTLAFEMALQMQAAGRVPSLLVVGDCAAPGAPRWPSVVRKAVGTAKGMWRRTLEDPRPSMVVRRAVRQTVLRGGRPHTGMSAVPNTQFHEEWERHLPLVSAYRPTERLACPVVLYRSAEHRHGRLGWSRHVAGPVMVRDLPGPHHGQIEESLLVFAQLLRLDLPEHQAVEPALAAS